MLGGFGGSYKKAASLKVNGKCQELIFKDNGIEECETFFGEVMSLFKSASFVQPGANGMEKYLTNVLQATWLYGYEAASSHVGQSPNGLASFRLLCSGEITWWLFDLKKLVPAMKIMLAKDNVGGLEGVSAFIKDLSAANAITLASHGCEPHVIVQK